MKQKVIIYFHDLDDSISKEIIWANKISDDIYEVDNIPFFSPNISYKDLIKVEKDSGLLYFEELFKPSGHSTIQIVFFDKSKAEGILKKLENFGCKWEGFENKLYYSVDIPPNMNYSKIKSFLDEAHKKGILDFKEACLSENHK